MKLNFVQIFFLKLQLCVIEVVNLSSLDTSTVSIICFFFPSSFLSFDFHLGKLFIVT